MDTRRFLVWVLYLFAIVGTLSVGAINFASMSTTRMTAEATRDGAREMKSIAVSYESVAASQSAQSEIAEASRYTNEWGGRLGVHRLTTPIRERVWEDDLARHWRMLANINAAEEK